MAEKESTRRHGDDLLESLFDATTTLMNDVRHTDLTFQQIAKEAKTSRTVLYRRWRTTFELLQDIYTYKAQKLFEGNFFNTLEDTGSLEGDLLQLLITYQQIYSEIDPEVLNNYYYLRTQDKGKNKEPAIHIKAVNKHIAAVKEILERAKVRGDQIKKVSTVTLMLPFDLIRMENLVRADHPINENRLKIMVQDILLTVFKA